jgi:acyl carrier protein
MSTRDPVQRSAIGQVIRKAFAFAAGVKEGEISDGTLLRTLAFDSMTILAAGVVIEAELGWRIDEEALFAMFSANSVADAIELAIQEQRRGTAI